jgi:uncharacterized protein YyaL (SSP411 family)
MPQIHDRRGDDRSCVAPPGLSGRRSAPQSVRERGHIRRGRRTKPKYAGPQQGDVKEFERKQLLERVEREGATVGASIPDEITVQGEEIALQEFVFEIRRRDSVPPGERDRVEQAKRNLRRERLQRKQRLEDETLTFEEGEQLVEAIVGLDRALNELEALGPVDVAAEAQAEEVADRKRWTRFLRKALGQEDETGGRGRGP